MKKFILRYLFLILLIIGSPFYATLGMAAEDSNFADIDLNDSWKFAFAPDVNAYAVEFDDSSWESVMVPHTWNGEDGQDGGNNYRRGEACYRKTVMIPESYSGKRLYMDFGAANTRAMLYVNGTFVGSHTGGYSRFGFDITDFVKFGEENLLAVVVNNSKEIQCPPLSGDFTMYGGLTRNVSLRVKNNIHFLPLEKISSEFLNSEISVANSGVEVKITDVSEAGATVSIGTNVLNSSESDSKIQINAILKDADGNIVAQSSDEETDIAAGEAVRTKKITIDVSNPHLWNGKADPYRYTLDIELKNGSLSVDRITRKIGFRYCSIDRDKGFYLNGKSYPLRGIAIHDQVKDKGRASSDEDRKRDLDIMLETGANFLRLAHYQHADFTYDYLDEKGIICWAEIPVVNEIPTTEEDYLCFRQNASSQMYELIRQLEWHPSIAVWGVCNEIRNNQPSGTENTVPLVQHLVDLVHSEDSTRPAVLAANYNSPENKLVDAYSMNRYLGWYGSTYGEIGPHLDTFYSETTLPAVGMSEYGAGANTRHHVLPVSQPEAGGTWHPEEYQNEFHEAYLQAINERSYLWQTSVWAGFDFAADSRNEGEQPGINDKGLVTHDRAVKKDAFYLYKAAWNKEEPVLYITSRRYTDPKLLSMPVKVYTNASKVELIVNGANFGSVNVENNIARWDNVPMKVGKNTVRVNAVINGEQQSDEVEWNCSAPIEYYPTVEPGDIQINFAASDVVVDEYLNDAGLQFGDRGNGYKYGWDKDATEAMRRRTNYGHEEDLRYSTFLQTYGAQGKFSWSIEVPNGIYKVSVCCGDPSYFDSKHIMTVNGVTAINFTDPSAITPFATATVQVVVSEGKITLSPTSDSTNPKPNFIHITKVSDLEYYPTVEKGDIQINFGLQETEIEGYLKDWGEVFGDRGNGYTYGWNADATNASREKSDDPADPKYNTHLMANGWPGQFEWSINLENGIYRVTLGCGDAQSYDSNHIMYANGVKVISFTNPTAEYPFGAGTADITVADGKLTVTPLVEGENQKLCFIHITRLNIPSVNGKALSGNGQYQTVSMDLTNGEKVTFSNFDTDIQYMLQPHFFSDIEGNTAVFKGVDGNYTFYFDLVKNVLTVASASMSYPNALWVTGKGYGHHTDVLSPEWQMSAPDAVMCNKVADGIFEATLYLGTGFSFKTFKALDWNTGIGSNVLTPYPEAHIDKALWSNAYGNAHHTGDFVSGSDFVPGLYTLRFDVTKGTCCLLELTGEDTPAEVYTVNGVAMVKDNSLPDYSVYSAELNLKKGETMEFGNIRHLQYLLQPEYFTKDGAGYKFAATDGTYKISYANGRELIYIERTDKIALDDDVLFLTGADFAHPASSAAFAEDVAGWGYDKPKDFVCCVTTAPGVYETNLYLKKGFMLRGYKDKGDGKWTNAVQPMEYTVLSEDGIGGRDDNNNFGVSDPEKFTEGTYHIVFDKNNKTAKFSPLAPNDFYISIPTGINEVAAGERSIVAIYDLQGRMCPRSAVSEPGLYIVKYSDGSSSKMLVGKK